MRDSNTHAADANSTATPRDGPQSDGATEPDSKPPEPAGGPGSESHSLEVLFGILSNRRRQLVLRYLRNNGGEATTGELAEHIAAIENDITVRELNAQQRKRVYVGLYQSHLPKMDDVEVIEFDQSRGRISPGRQIDSLYEYLDVADGDEPVSDGGRAVSEPVGETEPADSAVDEPTGDERSVPFSRTMAVGYLAFATAFFVAQLSGAHAIASGTVVLLLAGVLLLAYRSL